MSEQEAKHLSTEERLKYIKDIRWAFQHIGEHATDPANYNQFHYEVIQQAIKSIGPAVQALFEDDARPLR